jgi:hypothetical protein
MRDLKVIVELEAQLARDEKRVREDSGIQNLQEQAAARGSKTVARVSRKAWTREAEYQSIDDTIV